MASFLGSGRCDERVLLCDERGSQCVPPSASRHSREEDVRLSSTDRRQNLSRGTGAHDCLAQNGNEIYNEVYGACVSKIIQDDDAPGCDPLYAYVDSVCTQLLYSEVASRSHLSHDNDGADVVVLAGNPLTGVMSERGLRPEMEDAVTVAHRFLLAPCKRTGEILETCGPSTNEKAAYLPWHFFGVYDGHGGSQVSNICKQRLHVTLAKELRNIIDTENTGLGGCQTACERIWAKALMSTFCKVDAEIKGTSEGRAGFKDGQLVPLAPENVGSTAIVAIVGVCQIIVANCGDSRAVLSRGGQAIAMSDDHKPNRGDELRRIERAGGTVFNWNGYRVSGVLAMSRAIGDRYLKPFVIAEPEVKCVSRSEDDECLILASDGLWDVLSNEKVCEIARRCLTRRGHSSSGAKSACYISESNDKQTEAVAALLTKLALSKGSEDNISVVVVNLKETAGS